MADWSRRWLGRVRRRVRLAPSAENPSLGASAGINRCDLTASALTRIQRGVVQTRYRGRACLKSPFDLVLYMQLIERLRPKTVIEIGTMEGGSALWFADMLRAHDLPGRVITIDTEAPLPIDDPSIEWHRADARQLGAVLGKDFMATLEHPMLVVEDSAHTCETTRAVLDFFHPHLCSGDYMVIEDGIVRFLDARTRAIYEDGPLRAVAAFLRDHRREYEIDRSLCDFFGVNVTWNPDGYLRRLS